MGRHAAIVGIGETRYSAPGAEDAKSESWLACEAIRGAAADAGIATAMIDGLVSFANSALDPALLQVELAMPALHFSSMVWGGRGGGACGALAHAAMAVEAGQARCVAVFRSISQTQTRRYGEFFSERAHVNFTAPFGLVSPAQMNALVVQRYLHDYGWPADACAEIALLCRDNAQFNPRAQTYGRPKAPADYQASPLLASPLRKMDCCLESDGACAVLVTTPERARDLRRTPVLIAAAAQGSGPGWSSGAMGSHNMPAADYVSGNARGLGQRLFGMAGIAPSDVNVAQIYDHFTGMALISLEDFGFCERGTAPAFAASGALRHGSGRLPVNTAGGSLGEAYVHGMNLIAEAARQLRGDATRQVADAEVSFVCSGAGVAPTSAALFCLA
jgi:acetyl-CoA acetyltransferase